MKKSNKIKDEIKAGNRNPPGFNNKLNTLKNLGLFALMVLILLFGSATAVIATSIDAPTATFSIGDIVNLTVNVTGTDIVGSSFELTFDSTIIEVIDIYEGTLMTQCTLTTYNTLPPTFNNSQGKIEFQDMCLGQTISGAGDVAIITFKAISNGTSELGLQKTEVYNGTGDPIVGVTKNNGSIIVITCTPDLVNTPWSDWYNITGCRANGTILQERNLTQYDNNSCGEVENQTFFEHQEVQCVAGFCSTNNNCTANQFCNTTTNICQNLSCEGFEKAANHACYHICDLNYDGIYIHDYNDLMQGYKCFLGIKNCDNYYQNWNLIKQEYECFINPDN